MSGEMKKAALSYAARGWPVFPVREDKRPFPGSRGVLNATTDPAEIERLWEDHPGANVAVDVGAAGMMVLDLDPGYDWDELETAVGPIPDTRLVSRTPRGGEHLFFALDEGEIVAPSASKLAGHVDVRSFHSYVLLPPSRTDDGAYEWETELRRAKPAFRTDEMVRKANVSREKHKDRDEWLIEPDLPENVRAATAWLKKDARVAVEGRGGDHEAFATGAHMKSLGISEGKAFDLIWEHWNPRCDPPWDDGEEDHLRQKVQNAYRYNTSPPGNVTKAYRRAKALEVFSPVREKTPDGYKAKGKFRVVDRAAMEFLKPPEWLIENTIHREGFAVLYGAPGTYKTFAALDMALTLCTGTGDIPGCQDRRKNWTPLTQGRVLFCAGESPDYFETRIAAWEKLYNGGKQVSNFVMVDPVPLAMDESEWEVFQEEVFKPLLEDQFYDLIVVDTAASAMQGGDENNSKDMGNFVRMVQTLIRGTGAAVLVLHHTNAQGTMRGSGVLRGAVDTQIFAKTEDGQQTLTMAPPFGKQRNAAAWSEDVILRASPVQLGDDRSSLAMVRGEKQEAEAAPKAGEATTGNSGAFAPASRDAELNVLDRIVSGILSNNRLKQWSTKALAEAVAMDERCEATSPSLLRTRPGANLMTLRESKDKAANKLYDPATKRWRWRD